MSKRQRIVMINKLLKQAYDEGKEVSKDKLIAMMSLNWGTSERTAREYLRHLVQAGAAEEYFNSQGDIVIGIPGQKRLENEQSNIDQFERLEA